MRFVARTRRTNWSKTRGLMRLTAMPIGTPFSISAWYSPAKSTALQNVSDCGSAKENSGGWRAAGTGVRAARKSAKFICGSD